MYTLAIELSDNLVSAISVFANVVAETKSPQVVATSESAAIFSTGNQLMVFAFGFMNANFDRTFAVNENWYSSSFENKVDAEKFCEKLLNC